MGTISDIAAVVVSTPLAHPVRSHVRTANDAVSVIVRVRTDGAEGVGFVSAFAVRTARAVAEIVTELGAVLRGSDAQDVEAAHQRMCAATRLIGTAGLCATAIAGIDLALWDLRGRVLGLPVHRLLESQHVRLDTYASDGFWLTTADQVVREAEAAVAAGFTALKVRVGRPETWTDLQTLREVRDAVGDGVALMVDANQAWDLERVLDLGPKLAALDVVWLEEPLPADDLEGYAALDGVEVPIAAGESVFEATDLERLVHGGPVAVVMPDLQRLGGVTGWRRAVARIRRHDLQVASHLYPECSVHLLAAEPHPGPVEWVDWNRPFVEPPTRPRNGGIVVPDAPGFGLAYDWDAVRWFEVRD